MLPLTWWRRACRWRRQRACWRPGSGCSARQARRYAERAGVGARRGAAGHVVFTVKLPAGLAGRCARMPASRATISAVVAQALEEFLARGRRNHPRR